MVRDHLRFNLGIVCGPGSFAVLGSFADSYNTRVLGYLRACLHGGEGPQLGEVTRLAVVER